jgi:hypothetical protein
VALVAVGIAGLAAIAHAQLASATTLKTFTTPGTYTWKVPTGVTSVTFDVYGARGGGVNQFIGGVLNVISSGGPGGEARAKFKVHAGEVFEIVVGGQGGSATVGTVNGTAGFNGGGSPDLDNTTGGGGGGGSDVRIGGRGNPCVGSKSCGYGDRIIVGGGGGGGSDAATSPDGGAGGGLNGCCVATLFGTQESAGYEAGFGFGATAFVDGGGAGGGGGWYGGSESGGNTNGGAGGSGYISPFSLSGSFPGGTSVGNGKVIITT